MRASLYSTRNDAREQRKRDLLDAGLMSGRFPEVASVVVTMNYKHERASASVLRTLHFNPASPAYFKISCLGEGCEGGGLDLNPLIARMVRSREKSAKGRLHCENSDPAVVHAQVDYNVAITYA
jgi:hypothetical protein